MAGVQDRGPTATGTGVPAAGERAPGLVSDETAVTVSGLHKSYGDFVAVDGISFRVRKGEVFGLLGPNGAGKTTTLECLEGLRRRDGGELGVLGIDPERERRRLPRLIGVQLQSSGLPATMTVEEAMRFFGAYHQVAPRLDLLERLGLADKQDTRYDRLSTGLQRRLALALAVGHEPALVILDEPTAGLDVASRAELHRLIRELGQRGTTVLLATHDMAEAEALADRVAILLRGRIVAVGSPRELTASGSGLTKVSVRSERAILAGDEGAFPGVQQRFHAEEYAIFFTDDPGPTVSAILAYLQARGDPLIDLRVERPSLEERFLELTTQEAIP